MLQLKRKLEKRGLTEMDLKELLMKRAVGFDVEEVVEEYSEDENGKLKLNKRKVTKKFVPPDSIALKFLLMKDDEKDESNQNLTNLTYEELIALKNDLLTEINELEE